MIPVISSSCLDAGIAHSFGIVANPSCLSKPRCYAFSFSTTSSSFFFLLASLLFRRVWATHAATPSLFNCFQLLCFHSTLNLLISLPVCVGLHCLLPPLLTSNEEEMNALRVSRGLSSLGPEQSTLRTGRSGVLIRWWTWVVLKGLAQNLLVNKAAVSMLRDIESSLLCCVAVGLSEHTPYQSRGEKYMADVLRCRHNCVGCMSKVFLFFFVVPVFSLSCFHRCSRPNDARRCLWE